MSEVQFAKQFLSSIDSKNIKYPPDHVFDPHSFETRIPYTLPKLPHPPHPLPPTSAEPATPPPGSTAATPSCTIILKSTRNPAMSLTLTSLDPNTTTLQSLRESVQSTLGGPTIVPDVSKIKILWNKKPVHSSKNTVAEAIEGSNVTLESSQETELEFGIMVMGGAPDPPPQPSSVAPTPMVNPIGPGSEKAAAEAEIKPSLPTSVRAPADKMEGVESNSDKPPVQPGEPSGKEILRDAGFWSDLQGFLEQRIKDSSEAKKIKEVFEGAWKATL